MNNNWLISYVTNSHTICMYVCTRDQLLLYSISHFDFFFLFTYFLYIHVTREYVWDSNALVSFATSNPALLLLHVSFEKTLRSLVYLVNCTNNKCFSQNKVCDISIGLSYKREHIRTFFQLIIISCDRFTHYRYSLTLINITMKIFLLMNNLVGCVLMYRKKYVWKASTQIESLLNLIRNQRA